MESQCPYRKPTRLRGFDYSTPGAYFITICVKDRKQLLSKIIRKPVGDGILDVPTNGVLDVPTNGVLDVPANGVLDVPANGVLDVPEYELLEFGRVADKYIKNMSNFYKCIYVEKYVIMPNHIHLLIRITEDIQNGSSGTPNPTNAAIPRFVSTFKRFCNREFGKNIWQRSSHDHIIRGEKDYANIWEYIDTNILRWEKDCFYV